MHAKYIEEFIHGDECMKNVFKVEECMGDIINWRDIHGRSINGDALIGNILKRMHSSGKHSWGEHDCH